MILSLLKNTRPFPNDKKWGIENRRWALEIEPWYIQLVNQYLVKKEWYSDPAHYYAASLTTHFALGYKSVWHDGEHHVFSVGFLHFAWLG